MIFRVNRGVHLTPVVPQQDFIELARRSVSCVRYENASIVAQGEGAKVEKLVMHAAQRDAVSDDVGSVRLMPFDMRGLETDRHIADAHVEIAQRAAILICGQNLAAEHRITPLRGGHGNVERKSGRVQYVAMDALWKMPVEQKSRDRRDAAGIFVEALLNVVRKSPGRIQFA
jgi:hypothetical protein